MGFLFLIIIAFAVYALVKGAEMPRTILSHWHHRFETIPFSAQEFYQGVKDALASKKMNLVSVSHISYTQGGMLSPDREYLRIQYKEFIFDVCAAPFATEYFVSWWLGEMGNTLRDLFINLPLIGKLFNKRKKSFFELDTEIMFRETVSDCVKQAIEQLTQAKGVRKLGDADWKEYNRLY